MKIPTAPRGGVSLRIVGIFKVANTLRKKLSKFTQQSQATGYSQQINAEGWIPTWELRPKHTQRGVRTIVLSRESFNEEKTCGGRDSHVGASPLHTPHTRHSHAKACSVPQTMRREGFEPSNPLKGQDLKSCAFGQALLPPQCADRGRFVYKATPQNFYIPSFP